MSEFKIFGLVPISKFRREMMQGIKYGPVVLTTELAGDRIVTRFRDIPIEIMNGVKESDDD